MIEERLTTFFYSRKYINRDGSGKSKEILKQIFFENKKRVCSCYVKIYVNLLTH
jgi:hypothetical protein